jgi:glycosyltransferase involved in cell wall biosynthesis
VRAWGADRFHSIFPPLVVEDVPSVVTVFDLTPLSHPALHQPDVVRAFRAAMPRALAGASGIVAISHATAEAVRRRFPSVAPRVRVVGVGLPAELDAPAPAGRRAGVLYVGTIEPRKNVPVIIEAARRLRGRGCRTPVTIVGKQGWGDFDVASAIADVPGVHYYGYVDDRRLRTLYRRAAVFLYPSAVEASVYRCLRRCRRVRCRSFRRTRPSGKSCATPRWWSTRAIPRRWPTPSCAGRGRRRPDPPGPRG